MGTKQHLRIGAALLFCSFSGGCVLQHQPATTTRFFKDYTGFKKVDFKHETWVYQDPTVHVTDYDKFLITSVTVYENPQKKIKSELRPRYDELEAEFRQKLTAIFAKHAKLAKGPGPDVLKLQFVVSDIKPYSWLTKPDGTRYLRADTIQKGTTFEMDCRDAPSGARVFAIATVFAGDKYMAYANPDRIPEMQAAFNKWARFLEKLFTVAEKDRSKSKGTPRK